MQTAYVAYVIFHRRVLLVVFHKVYQFPFVIVSEYYIHALDFRYLLIFQLRHATDNGNYCFRIELVRLSYGITALLFRNLSYGASVYDIYICLFFECNLRVASFRKASGKKRTLCKIQFATQSVKGYCFHLMLLRFGLTSLRIAVHLSF